MTEYRLYTFTNMYLSPIQCGIQTAHLTHTLFTDWMFEDHHDPAWQALISWAKNDMTMIVLNGGYSSELNSIYDQLSDCAEELGLPYASWCESNDALDGALTCVGVVVPDIIYDAVENATCTGYEQPGTSVALDGEGLELYNIIKGYPLA